MKSTRITRLRPAHTDARGSITDVLNEKVSHIGLITTRKNAVRGTHYHLKSHQYSYIQSGSFEVWYAPLSRPGRAGRRVLAAGDLIELPPRTIHRFRALSAAVMIDIISESRARQGYEKDVFRVEWSGKGFVLPKP